MTTIKRISVDELQVGMYVAELSNEWIPDTNARKHGLIKRESAIEQVRRFGIAHVYIDADKGADCANGILLEEVNEHFENQLGTIERDFVSGESSIHSHSLGDVPLEEELENAKEIHVDALSLVSQVMNDVKMGGVVDLQPVEDMADSISESIRRNQNALSCFTRMRHKDEYLMEHSFSVAVLMGVLARSMRVNGDDLHQMVTGALLHDIGKIQIDENILNKPGSLTPEEWEEMKRHVEYGEVVMEQTKDVPLMIKQMCQQHHERLDGTGYPRGLSNEAITLHGRMTAIVDVYDAITADRCYHKGMTPSEAMKKLVEWSGDHLDKDIVYQFIACMSIFPAGSLVELDNRQLAFVRESNLKKQRAPLVEIVWDIKNQSPLPKQLINLSLPSNSLKIVRAVDPNDFGIILGDRV
ncbi:MAG: HD-GYP domain-containing protein [Cellvibrionaceae bacterium]